MSLELRYHNCYSEHLKNFFSMDGPGDMRAFYYDVMRMHLRVPER